MPATWPSANAQTAADVAALAGASTLRAHKVDWVSTPATAVLAEVASVVEDNGAVLEAGGWELVRAEHAVSHADADVIADCEQLGYLTAEIKNLGRDCGNPSSDWRGPVRLDTSFAVPSPDQVSDVAWWQTESGNKDGQLPETIAGNSCSLDAEGVDQLTVGCRIAVPLCPKSNGNAADFRMYCVKLGAFQITHVGPDDSATAPAAEDGSPSGEVTNNIICGRFLGAATAIAGQGIAQRPDPNSIVVIKLVE